ncbi:hypothetical protein ACP275_14G241600 [Erythranthe tilingii]
MENESVSDEFADGQIPKKEDTSAGGIAAHEGGLNSDGFPRESCPDDDWEAMADRAPEELLSPQSLPCVSKLSLEDQESQSQSQSQSIKRRGRGTFAYKKHGLYSDDSQSHKPLIDDDNSEEDNSIDQTEETVKRKLIYGTHHVLVIADMPLSTNTIALEKLLKKFKDTFVIRWLNDTTSLAVFRTPSIALEASNSIQWPYTVRVLTEDDELLDTIPPNELEPPRQRPQTSARAAQRLIANSMGIKLPSSSFGASELRKQEEARKNRIVSRQNLRDDAWGDDDSDNQDKKISK